MNLTQDQIDTFHRDGFLRYGRILDEEEISVLRVEYDRVFKEAEESEDRKARALTADEQYAEEGSSEPKSVLQIMQMCERNLHFRRLLYHSDILDVVEDLIGPNIQLFHDQALSKPPHTGGPIPWHQDNGYWQCRPANLVSCWLTLDDVDVKNGAMQLLPGSHLQPQGHEQGSGTLLESKEVNPSKAVVIDLHAGGCMFHHCQTLHHTAPNQTDRQRRALAIHFMTPGTVRTRRNTGKTSAMPPSFEHPILRMRI